MNPFSFKATRPDLRRALAGTLVFLALSLGACTESSTKDAEFYVFGTLVEVKLAGVDDDLASDAFGELQLALQKMHRDWHPWEPGRLTAINRAFAVGEPARADQDIITLIHVAQEFEIKTGGRFNAAIGRLVSMWGFHTSQFPIVGPIPRPGEIQAVVGRHPSALDIEIHGDTVANPSRAVQLDFSGLAKGYAVDQACHILHSLGIDNALIGAGGDLRGFGKRGDRPWRIAIRNPLGGVIGTIEIQGDESVFTSGNYERFHLDDHQERYPHILDPRTGWPTRDIMSATVITHEGVRADAAATALVVAGIEDWENVAAPLGISEVLITDERGQIFATRPMLDRVSLSAGLKAHVIGRTESGT
ncbi:FAD:protein FMN transferase [Elongatibacter sediminis]|uniref:FAD:protein FMN transferase n=1 Tax=Elongatibacter sediminis TaxID=3119006 RepID=A0AAW9RCB1_9GAMM